MLSLKKWSIYFWSIKVSWVPLLIGQTPFLIEITENYSDSPFKWLKKFKSLNSSSFSSQIKPYISESSIPPPLVLLPVYARGRMYFNTVFQGSVWREEKVFHFDEGRLGKTNFLQVGGGAGGVPKRSSHEVIIKKRWLLTD